MMRTVAEVGRWFKQGFAVLNFWNQRMKPAAGCVHQLLLAGRECGGPPQAGPAHESHLRQGRLPSLLFLFVFIIQYLLPFTFCCPCSACH